MDIAALNDPALHAASSIGNPIGQALGIVMLDKQLELTQTMSQDMVKAMERSVNPAVGGNIDMYV